MKASSSILPRGDGEPPLLSLDRVAADSVLWEFGLREGDVIALIDGEIPQFSPTRALDYIRNLDADETIRSLKQTLLYGLKGIAAYADHAWILGQKDDVVFAFIHEAMASMLNKTLTLQDWLGQRTLPESHGGDFRKWFKAHKKS